MPEPGAGFLRHLDAVTGITQKNRIYRLGFEVLQLHGVVVLITAESQDHALARFDVDRFAICSAVSPITEPCVHHQFFRRRGDMFDLTPVDIVGDHFEKPRAAAQSLGPGEFR